MNSSPNITQILKDNAKSLIGIVGFFKTIVAEALFTKGASVFLIVDVLIMNS